MNENLKKFLEEASKNEELKAKLAALTDKDTAVAKAVELAKEYGFALTAEDFQPADGAELSLDELDSVAGGSVCLLFGGGHNKCAHVGMSDGPKKRPYCEKCQEFVWDGTVGTPHSCGTILVEKESLF
jgi:predicted ribosomally synthesized peptide with nif11-like leader